MLRGGVVSGRRNPLHYGLAERLKTSRKQLGETRHGLSVAAGLASPVVASIEEGGIPRLDTVERIAQVLKLSPCLLAYAVDSAQRSGAPFIEAPFIEREALLCAGVGGRLRQVREARGLSLRALARAAGTTPTTIGYIEEGRQTPTVATCEALAKALQIDPCYLAYGQGPAPELQGLPDAHGVRSGRR